MNPSARANRITLPRFLMYFIVELWLHFRTVEVMFKIVQEGVIQQGNVQVIFPVLMFDECSYVYFGCFMPLVSSWSNIDSNQLLQLMIVHLVQLQDSGVWNFILQRKTHEFSLQ